MTIMNLKNVEHLNKWLSYGENEWNDIEVFETETKEFVGYIHKDSTGFKMQCNINYKGYVKKLATRCNINTAFNLLINEYKKQIVLI